MFRSSHRFCYRRATAPVLSESFARSASGRRKAGFAKRFPIRVLAAVVLCSVPDLASCTYDFDQFVTTEVGGAESGGPSTGGTSSALTAASGGMSTAITASGMNSGTGGTSSVATAFRCVGVEYASVCWYLGSTGSSCNQVCVSHGQTAANMASVVGTQAQGGSLQQCATLLALLGVSQSLSSGTRSDGAGLGCHVYQSAPWWLTSPAFSPSASNPATRIVCGCTE